MKKQYMAPKTEMVLTELEQMLSTSPSGTNVYGSSARGDRDVLSKRRGDYDDDEDDDLLPSIW